MDLCHQTGAKAFLLHVIENPVIPLAPRDLHQAGGVDPALLETLTDSSMSRIEMLVTRYRAHGLDVEGRVVVGSAWREILRAAQATEADLIVVGTHGRRALPRALLGSVAAQVIRNAHCPVFTVPTRQSETSHAAVTLI